MSEARKTPAPREAKKLKGEKTIELSKRYYLKALKNHWHTMLFEDVEGLPKYDGEQNGDRLRFIWRAPDGTHVFTATVSRVVAKPAMNTAYLRDVKEL